MHRIMAEQSGQNSDSEDDEDISNSEESKVGCNLFRSTSGKGAKDCLSLIKRLIFSIITFYNHYYEFVVIMRDRYMVINTDLGHWTS